MTDESDGWNFEQETSDYSSFDDEKCEWLESQVRDRLKFGIETREVLLRESHVTLKWLIAFATGPVAFISNSAVNGTINWPICHVLAIATVVAAIFALYLMTNCLMAVDVYGLGNSPENLIRKSFVRGELRMMKLYEIKSYATRIGRLRETNSSTARALNTCRYACTLIPVIGAVAVMAVLLLERK